MSLYQQQTELLQFWVSYLNRTVELVAGEHLLQAYLKFKYFFFFSEHKLYQKVALTISGQITLNTPDEYQTGYLTQCCTNLTPWKGGFFCFFFSPICFLSWLVLGQLFPDIITHVLCDQWLGIPYPHLLRCNIFHCSYLLPKQRFSWLCLRPSEDIFSISLTCKNISDLICLLISFCSAPTGLLYRHVAS